jgi:hypothetical protein
MWTMVKGYAHEKTIDRTHIHEIGNLNEIGRGVRIEVHELYETVLLNREDTVSGLFFFCA